MNRPAGRDELTDTAADAAIEQACRILRLPTIREQHARVAEAAARQKAGYKGFLVELLSMECDEREDRRKSRLVREACDTLAAIPISATIESLNAGVAAGIALYEINRQRT